MPNAYEELLSRLYELQKECLADNMSSVEELPCEIPRVNINLLIDTKAESYYESRMIGALDNIYDSVSDKMFAG